MDASCSILFSVTRYTLYGTLAVIFDSIEFNKTSICSNKKWGVTQPWQHLLKVLDRVKKAKNLLWDLFCYVGACWEYDVCILYQKSRPYMYNVYTHITHVVRTSAPCRPFENLSGVSAGSKSKWMKSFSHIFHKTSLTNTNLRRENLSPKSFLFLRVGLCYWNHFWRLNNVQVYWYRIYSEYLIGSYLLLLLLTSSLQISWQIYITSIYI